MSAETCIISECYSLLTSIKSPNDISKEWKKDLFPSTSLSVKIIQYQDNCSAILLSKYINFTMKPSVALLFSRIVFQNAAAR